MLVYNDKIDKTCKSSHQLSTILKKYSDITHEKIFFLSLI